MAFENQAKARGKQDVAVFRALAAVDEDLAAIEIDVSDLDVDQFADPHRRIEEELHQDLLLHIAGVLDSAKEAFEFGVGQELG